MRVTKIRVQNFRILKDISVDLEDELSVIIGKNNCGKTSLLLILDRFLGNNVGKPSFTFDDFNTDFKENLKARIEDSSRDGEPFLIPGISLKLFIEYNEEDDLSNIGNKAIMDLDPDNKIVVLAFQYYISEERFLALRTDYQDQKSKKQEKSKDLFVFLKDQHSTYFQLSKKSVLFDLTLQKENDAVFTDLIKENIKIDKIISFKYINAKRNVSNRDADRALSSLSSKIYKKMETSKNNPAVVEKFKDTLSDTDKQLDNVYEEIFREVIHDVKKFGGMRQDDSIIKIISSLQHRELLEENTTVMYYGLNTPGHSLPESYNGLGYMNLISMIFEIKILLHEFQREKEEKPSDINLLFIEEPEVHTHPQMQCVFIKNIKSLLENGVVRESGETKNLQTILSTHSAHIVSESEFEDIKYFKRNDSGITSKNLKDLEREYGEFDQHYKFLRQYLTLHNSQLFFADKAIFIEGDTERVLLPSIMKKIDQDDFVHEFEEGKPASLPLLSQNISIIEVGAYSQVFEKFMDFIGIKSLIITDIDSTGMVPELDENGVVKKNSDNTNKLKREACPVATGDQTSNTSLEFFYKKDKKLSDFISLTLEHRVLKKDSATKAWIHDANGHLLCVYQTMEKADNIEYHARSFEDAFLHINRQFISDHTFDSQSVFIGDKKFPSLTQGRMKKFAKSEIDSWEMAKGIDSKPSFAMEILLNSKQKKIELKNKSSGEKVEFEKDFSNWNTPSYIREGLRWLKQD